MASKLAVYETGYEDERFEQIVSETLHCIICTNVIKDPVMCQRNEHLFCRACITIHLMYSNTCPTCMEPLTVETLRQARTIMNLLSELKIRCEFYKRGCGKVVQLGELERHVADCGFAPAVCSNEGCQLEVNKQDLLHHETTVCELRRVKCHSCNDIRREMDTVKVDLAAIHEKLDRNEARLMATLEKLEKNEKAVENAVAQGIKQIQDIIERKKSDEKLDRNEKTLLKTLERIETNRHSPRNSMSVANDIPKSSSRNSISANNEISSSTKPMDNYPCSSDQAMAMDDSFDHLEAKKDSAHVSKKQLMRKKKGRKEQKRKKRNSRKKKLKDKNEKDKCEH